MNEREPFEGWCILELMGHRRMAGYVCEVEIAGKGFLRIDVHRRKSDSLAEAPRAIATQFVSPNSVYALTPTTEELAREIGEKAKPEPVSPFEVERLPAPDRVMHPHGHGAPEEGYFDDPDDDIPI